MNDCIWCWIRKCEGENCRCNKYLSVNSKKGDKLREKYEKMIEKRATPIIKEIADEVESDYLDNEE